MDDLEKILLETANELGCEPDNEEILAAVNDLKQRTEQAERELERLSSSSAQVCEIKRLRNELKEQRARHKETEHESSRDINALECELRAEHQRLKMELSKALGHDATNPSMCDLVAVAGLVVRERDALAAQLDRPRVAIIGDLMKAGLDPEDIPSSINRLKAQIWREVGEFIQDLFTPDDPAVMRSIEREASAIERGESS